LKLSKQKSPSREQLITFGWIILNFSQILNLKLGEKLDIRVYKNLDKFGKLLIRLNEILEFLIIWFENLGVCWIY
jgi:hypothetical protein